ncbi:MAG: hypothetical protein QM770_11000 [Tepidisphaeraceae bacterium]
MAIADCGVRIADWKTWALVCGIGLAGCGAVVSDDLAIASSRYDRGGSASIGLAPATGAYELRTWPDGETVAQYTVRKGDPLGFEQPRGDTVTAVAGSVRQPVTTDVLHRAAYWIYVGQGR